MKRLKQLQENLKDERSMEVIFVSHCLLNINTRYLGGAFRRGSVNEIVTEAMEKGVGIIQIECPEKHAWGGVLKKFMWLPLDSKHSFVYRLFLPVFICYTRIVYRRIALSLVKDIQRYIKSGFTVKGIVGVDGSPTCGVNTKLDVNKCFGYLSRNSAENLSRETFNSGLYKTCSEVGAGMFFEILKKFLDRKRLSVPIYAHSLISEMQGESSEIWRRL